MDKQEIIESRIGALGSSDAAFVAKIGKRGHIEEADKYRIAVMLGLEETKMFSNKYTEIGNDIEESVFEALHTVYGNVVSNPMYKSEKLSKRYGFGIISHIDYEVETDDKLIWIENKATKFDISETIDTYIYQLAWHGILLEEKSKEVCKYPCLYLSHYDTNIYNESGFDAKYLTLRRINFEQLKHSINLIFEGLRIVSDAIKYGFDYVKREEFFVESLPPQLQSELQQISFTLNKIKEYEKSIDCFKSKMLKLMQENNVKSIKNDYFNITVVPETTTSKFDSKMFSLEHPKLAKKYQKQEDRKAYVKITIKTE